VDEVTGLDFLVWTHELHRTAKRILLIGRRDWSATNPAVQAMALGHIDSYLFEPWLCGTDSTPSDTSSHLDVTPMRRDETGEAMRAAPAGELLAADCAGQPTGGRGALWVG
jgi:hypothetical protein